jgi:hypothetical protein
MDETGASHVTVQLLQANVGKRERERALALNLKENKRKDIYTHTYPDIHTLSLVSHTPIYIAYTHSTSYLAQAYQPSTNC